MSTRDLKDLVAEVSMSEAEVKTLFKTSTSDSTNNVQWCSASLRNSRAAEPEIFHFFSSMRSSRSLTLQRFNEKFLKILTLFELKFDLILAFALNTALKFNQKYFRTN